MENLGDFTPGSGQVGVMLFFCLSGFLMGRLYMNRSISLPAVGDFFRRRVARVLPLYLIVVGLSYAFIALHLSVQPFFSVTDKNLWEHLLFWRGTSVLWTIPVEVQFYATFPLIWLLYRKTGQMLLPCMALAVSAVAMFGFPKTPVLFDYAPFFLFGIAASLFPKPETNRGLDIVFVVMLVGYFVIFPGVRKHLGIMSSGVWSSPVYMFFMPAFLLATLYSPLAGKVLGNPVARFAGAISYSAYLLHMPVMHEVLHFYPHLTLSGLAVFLVATTIVAWASYRLVENPLRRLISNASISRFWTVKGSVWHLRSKEAEG